MTMIMKAVTTSILSLWLCIALSTNGFSQSAFWTGIDGLDQISRSNIPLEKDVNPIDYSVFQLDLEGFKTHLSNAPMENTRRGSRNPLVTEIPTPDGEVLEFHLTESPMMEAGLAEKFPDIKTFKGTSKDGLSTGRFDLTSHGFHGIVFHPEGTYYINPYNRSTRDFYISYFIKDNFSPENSHQIECGVGENQHDILDYMGDVHNSEKNAELRSSVESFPLLTYRMAVAATGEYTQYHGGTVNAGLSAIVTAINRVNSIFERDLGIRFLLVENNDTLIFTNPGSDGFYTNGNPGQMIDQNQSVLANRIGSENFDIGHVFGTSTTLGGLAGLGNVCSPGKARGVSTHRFPVNDPFIVAIVCHELGHQFGASHTMYSCHNVNASTAYEPGSGSTIMAYTGICASGNNLQSQADPYFHVNSLEVMLQFSRSGAGSDCAVEVPTDNIPPVIEMPYQSGFHIPVQTPFKLEAAASDENDEDILTYSWEQYDIGPSLDPVIPLGESIGNSPLFRVWPPTEEPARYFPRLQDLTNNIQRPFELLPDTTRTLTFRFVVRDNNMESGASTWEQIRFFSTDQAGPFEVIYPNARDSLKAGDFIEVLWDVANTDQPPVNSRNVDILLSADRGITYPYTLLENAPNSGSAFVNIPNVSGNLFRIKVRAADNIFFDISDQNFIVTEPTEPGVILDYNPYPGLLCLPENLAVDIETESLLGFSDTLFFEITSPLPDGAVPIHIPQYIIPGESTNFEIDFTQTPTGGSFQLDFVVFNDSIEPMERSVFFDMVSNDYSDLALKTPLNGQSNLPGVVTFEWNPVDDADGYEFQLATNPSFSQGDIVYEETVMDIDSVQPLIQLETSKVFYWRIRPFNICGTGDYSEIFAFQTRSRECEEFVATDVPIQIPAQSQNNFDSQISIEHGGFVDQIVIPNVRGSQPFVGDIQLSLLSPSGTQITLVRGKCAQTSGYDLGFDDNAPVLVGIPPCTLTSRNLYIPEEPLATFSGEPLEGVWTMRVNRLSSGSPGQLQAWNMEVCFDADFSQISDLRNDTLKLRPMSSNEVSREVLRARSTFSSPQNVKFVLTSLPELGELSFAGTPIQIGQTFTQNDIDNNLITYTTEIDTFGYDHFKFVVRDELDGWRGIERFEIKISDDWPTFTEDPIRAQTDMVVFPNPTDGWVNYRVNGWEGQEVRLTVVSVDGKVLSRQRVLLSESNVIDLRSLPSGTYFLGISGEKGNASGKIIVE
jgi:subtilisin-like proprotein convertase family protein